MSIWLVLGLAWFGLALLGWACMTAAALGDRAQVRPVRAVRPPDGGA